MANPPNFNHHHYVPCLRWKQGEYQALLRLPQDVKDGITPLFEVPEIGWDFESQEDAKTVDEHLAKLAKRVVAKWSTRWAFVDLKLLPPDERMKNGQHPMQFVFDDLRANGAFCIPVTGLDRDDAYHAAVLNIISKDSYGVCLRVPIQETIKGDFMARTTSLLSYLSVKTKNVDFILDLGAPNFEPLDGFVKMVNAIVKKLPYLNEWRTFTITGTSFPETMGQLDIGAKIEKRYEWLFFKAFLKTLGQDERKPTFGDYAISNPKVVQIDMRIAKPAASIRYTIDDAWYIIKGANVRDHGFAQYYKHCAKLVSSGLYMGESYSAGDDHINKCVKKLVKTPGNLTTWRWVGTNHHIQKVVNDIANLNVA